MSRIRTVLEKLLRQGVDPKSAPGERKYVRYTNAAAMLAFLMMTAFFVLELPIIADLDDLGPRELVIIGLRFVAGLLFLIPIVLNRSGRQASGRLVFGISAIACTTGLTWLYGSAAPTQLYFIGLVACLIAIFPARERRAMTAVLGLTLLAFGLSLYLKHLDRPLVPINRPEIRIVVDVLVALGALALVFALSLAQRSAGDAAEAEVVKQREKADGLLLNILPEVIADRLKESHGAIADGFDDVTVMFADLVGFTPLSQTMSPHELVALMDRVFSRFDRVAERHGLEKIKTIGDAYMVAGGIPIARSDHAAAIADMALELLPIVDEVETPGGEPLRLRIGIASGPAVAGVIGKKKFAYDLWGDTVNTASRMESHGEAGRIQVNEEAYRRLKDAFEFSERRLVAVKGKGEMATFYLLGRR